VLAVEDNAINREVVVELLGAIGLAIDVAGDGLEALDKARAARYDLILMDLQMPRMDGIEATRAIRALPGYAATPIIALTANAYSEDRRNAIAAGMNDFVAKPVSPEQLYAVLAKWLPGALSGLKAAAQDIRPRPLRNSPQSHSTLAASRWSARVLPRLIAITGLPCRCAYSAKR
jgi:two-component system sensor histidine kinase/response regulator